MSEPRKKRVLRFGQEIGHATTWTEVEAALISFGLDTTSAAKERLLLGVEGKDAFHIVAPRALDDMLAETRRIQTTHDPERIEHEQNAAADRAAR